MLLHECLKVAKSQGFSCAGYFGNPIENHPVKFWASLDTIRYKVITEPAWEGLNHGNWFYNKFVAQIGVCGSHWQILHLYKEPVEQMLLSHEEPERKLAATAKEIQLRGIKKSQERLARLGFKL